MEIKISRRKTHTVLVGKTVIGSEAPVTVQSMTNTDTHDYDATYRQIRELENAGCDIVRLAVPDVVACIALEAAAAGIDKIRINPGNIGS